MRVSVLSVCLLSSVAVSLMPGFAVSAQRIEKPVQPDGLEDAVEPDQRRVETRVKIRMDVDLTELVVSKEREREALKTMREEILAKSKAFLLQEGYDVVAEKEDAHLEVHMKWKDRDTFLQGLWMVVKMDGEEVKGEELSEMECAYCTKEDLARQTTTVLLPAALEVVKRRMEEKKAKANAIVTNEPKNGNGQKTNGKQPPTNGQKDIPEPKPLKGPRPLQVGGWGATGVGAATLGAGIGLWVQGKPSEVNPERIDRLKVRDYATPGTVMVGVGAALLISGIAMVTVDYVQTKKAREEAKKKRVQVFPAMSRTSFGIGLTSRF